MHLGEEGRGRGRGRAGQGIDKKLILAPLGVETQPLAWASQGRAGGRAEQASHIP